LLTLGSGSRGGLGLVPGRLFHPGAVGAGHRGRQRPQGSR